MTMSLPWMISSEEVLGRSSISSELIRLSMLWIDNYSMCGIPIADGSQVQFFGESVNFFPQVREYLESVNQVHR
jgi:hypothetical protein